MKELRTVNVDARLMEVLPRLSLSLSLSRSVYVSLSRSLALSLSLALFLSPPPQPPGWSWSCSGPKEGMFSGEQGTPNVTSSCDELADSRTSNEHRTYPAPPFVSFGTEKEGNHTSQQGDCLSSMVETLG